MIVLVVPCYNEEKRLDLEAFEEGAQGEVQILFTDDGSKDNTVAKIQQFIQGKPNLHVHRCPKNGGKAAAVREGMLHVLTHPTLSKATWVGFWDADLATPLWEVPNMIQYAELYSNDVDSIWGSRVYRLGSKIVRSPKRHYLGRGFATLISILLRVESYDSQCGAKLFRAEHVKKAFGEGFLSNWIFDVEIMLRLKGHNLIEYPLRQWEDVPGSKVKVYKEILRVFRDILRIRKKYLD
ncbi:glycosyltransferase [Bdellovibrio sp. HCB337]|uniref:glycosyltransferase n=1 Tax=Bdellovibrio sp. HCB337 TaxID=3394358 RepID=UPI0039A5E75F